MTFALPALDWWAIAPMLVLSLTGCMTLVADLLQSQDAGRAPIAWMTVLGVAVAAGIAIALWGDAPRLAFADMVYADPFTQFFTVLFVSVTAVTVLFSFEQLGREDFHPAEFYTLVAFASVGMVVMAAAADLIMVFLGIELLSVCLYVLTGFSRRRLESAESAIKYLLLGALASAFFLYGTALVYGGTGSTNLACVGRAVGVSGGLTGECEGAVAPGAGSKALLLAGVGLLIVGLGFKAALVPFHSWAPDVYEGAPTSITAYMSVGVKAAAFATMLRIFLIAFPTLSPDWSIVLSIVATLTMIAGNTAALLQTNIKRMLGYSSIAHAGYILVAIVAASHLGATSLLLYAVAYTVMNLGAFAVVVIMGRAGDERVRIADYAGLSRRQPLVAALMATFMLSLAGIPPTVGFVGKFYVFSAAVEAGFTWLALVGLVSSVASVYYYLRVVYQMYIADPASEVLDHTPHQWLSLVAVVAGVAVLVLGLLPGGIIAVANASTAFVK
jgi:NADH-quinone oxidoreductase subunit N